MSQEYRAHTNKNNPPHGLDEHLLAVGQKAASFADAFQAGDWAYLAGLWHDLGKYHKEFQHYITTHATDADAHNEPVEDQGKKSDKGPDHSTAGALYALDKLGDRKGRILAHLIAAHHTGLLDWQSTQTTGASPLANRLECAARKRLFDTLPMDDIPDTILKAPLPTQMPSIDAAFGASLWIRMLFSCLVDADFLDTESYMDGNKHAVRNQPYKSLAQMKTAFDTFMERKAVEADNTEVNRLRAEVLQQSRTKASEAPGLFSLTVPTGGGKTLSSLAFALEHAVQHQKRRIIYVIPYTSIIEQTADVFRGVFSAEEFSDHIIEHHSTLDPETQTTAARLAAENWDAPLIVTTSVQFLESLFAARTSRLRKLHNIVNSVVIFDEAQLLPPEFLQPILRAIEELKKTYGVTVVFATATQPELGDSNKALARHHLQKVHEIIPDPASLFNRLKRVQVHLPELLAKPSDWPEIAERLAINPSVLCIVGRRQDARDLYHAVKQLLPPEEHEGFLHLSALMCGQHRTEVIQTIRHRLKQGLPTRVISTQLVEAGVDVSFPVVFRALAGLDSIAQAAGRCNREGELPQGKQGNLYVFVPPKPAPLGILRKAEDVAKELLHNRNLEIFAPETFRLYFSSFYSALNNLDTQSILCDLKMHGLGEIRFRTAAHKFRLIDDSHNLPVIVLHGTDEKQEEIRQDINMLQGNRQDRWILRKLQRYTITIPRQWHKILQQRGDIEEALPGIYAQKNAVAYHAKLGFIGDNTDLQDPENFIA